MKPPSLPPIPIPWSQRWRDLRQRVLPLMVFGTVLVIIAGLWTRHEGAPHLVGQADAVVAHVSAPKAGVLTGCSVTLFQRVRSGETLGHMLVAEPRLIEAALAVIRSELDMLRANLEPIVAQQRAAVNYAQLRLDWMKHRAELATARVTLHQAEAEYRRTRELFKDRIASASALDEAEASFKALEQKVGGLEQLVTEGERSLASLQPENADNLTHVSDEPIRAAIHLQEAKLRLTEAELSPLVLRAPMDGVITSIHHRSGEAVLAGSPILSIAATDSTRIVGYLRAPFRDEPRSGDRVQVRLRHSSRQVGVAEVRSVGAQLQPLPDVFHGALRLGGVELALPVDISLPHNLPLRPGELVDLFIVRSGAD